MTGMSSRACRPGPQCTVHSPRGLGLVGGRELAGERVARPQPAARDDEPQRVAGAEERGRRPQRYVDGHDLPRLKRLRAGARRHRLERPGLAAVEAAQRGLQPAGRDPVPAEPVRPLERHVAPPAPLLHAREQADVIGAVCRHPDPQRHRPGDLRVGGDGPFPAGAAGPGAEGELAVLGGRRAREPVAGEVQRPPFGAVERPVLLVPDGPDDVAAFPDLEPDPRRGGDVPAAQVAVEEGELGGAGFGGVEREPLAAAMGVQEPVGALDALPAAKRAAGMQVVVGEAAADQGRNA